jgi:hypothetical protein
VVASPASLPLRPSQPPTRGGINYFHPFTAAGAQKFALDPTLPGP